MSENEETYMSFAFDFYTPIKITIEETETEHGVAMISGTLLVEGISRNGNVYTIEEMENIAKQAEGKPIYYGVKNGPSPNTGVWTKNLHDDSSENKIGKILKTALDKIHHKVTFIGEVVNTPKFPDITKKIKEGWGISIGGFVTKAKWFLNESKKLCLKIQDMVVEHVALVNPSIIRGQDAAKVESVNVQETMLFDMPEDKWRIILTSGRGCIIKGFKESE